MQADDVRKIIEVIYMYSMAVDGLRFDLFDHVFTKDVVADFGGPAVWRDLDSLKRDFEAIHKPFRASQHATSNHQVVVNGDTATCLCYVTARFVRDNIEGGNQFESVGWYDDVLTRTPAGWRIKHRYTRSFYATGNPRVLLTTEQTHVEAEPISLSKHAAEGRIAYLKALDATLKK